MSKLGIFLLFLLFPVLNGALSFNHTKRVSSRRLARIQSYLDKINKPAVRSIKSPDGDIIDCVPIHKQPAFDHPLLTNHKIQVVAPMMPKLKNGRIQIKNYTDTMEGAWQTWHHAGHCPKNTIPVRRSTVDDVLRAKSLYHYGKKQLRMPSPTKRSIDAPDVVSVNGHEHAIAYTGTSQEVYGAKATINVWDPSIQESNEFSLSQVWVLSGSFEGSDLNSIEAGWQVSHELYGDNKPRLFIYWTTDGYRTTGCYNLMCSGFVQTNNKVASGAAISPVSSNSGNQFDITILLWKDRDMGYWWITFGDGTPIGYWPPKLFTHLADHATMIQWGGEVFNMHINGVHTSTQMGSGRFAEDGFRHASYFRNLEIVDKDFYLRPVGSVDTAAENTDCYDIKSSSGGKWGTYFFYGGPGRNPKCP